MIKITRAEQGSEYLEKYRKWVSAEWGEVENLLNSKNDSHLPMPLLAFDDDVLVGGLSFIYYKNPKNSKNAIWINTVFIEPENRGRGIAGILIKNAENILSRMNRSELFVYTDKPGLYLKLNWEVINNDNDKFVLKKRLIH